MTKALGVLRRVDLTSRVALRQGRLRRRGPVLLGAWTSGLVHAAAHHPDEHHDQQHQPGDHQEAEHPTPAPAHARSVAVPAHDALLCLTTGFGYPVGYESSLGRGSGPGAPGDQIFSRSSCGNPGCVGGLLVMAPLSGGASRSLTERTSRSCGAMTNIPPTQPGLPHEDLLK